MSVTKTELKDIQSLLSKKGRKLNKKFLAEGVRLLEEALRYRVRPETVYYAQAALSERGYELLERFRKGGIRTEGIHLKQLESIAGAETTQGLIATFPEWNNRLTELYRPGFRRVLLCEEISDPGNLGTMIRSALAFAFDMVILTKQSADPSSPKVVRASAGAIFGIPIAQSEYGEIRELVTRGDVCLLATDAKGETRLDEVVAKEKKRTLVLAVGSEADGLSQEMRSLAIARVRISHTDAVESLNAAIAGSILMHDMYLLTK